MRTHASYLTLLAAKTMVLAIVLYFIPLTPSLSMASDNMVGLYFEIGERDVCLQGDITYPAIGSCWLLVENITESCGIGGWEGRVRTEGTFYLSLTSLGEEGAVNFGSGEEFVVGFASPQYSSDYVVLAEFGFVALGPGGAEIMPSGNPTMGPGFGPKYICGCTDEHLVTMVNAYGGFGSVSASIGCADCPIANHTAGIIATQGITMDSLKSLYR